MAAMLDHIIGLVLRAGRVEQTATPHDLLSSPANDYVATLLQRASVHA